MSQYTIGTIAKALMAFGVSAASTAAALAGGPDLGVLELGQWLAVIGAGFTAGGGVFLTPNKNTETPAEQVAKGVQAAIENSATANRELEIVRNAISTGVGTLPGFGPLAQQIINSVPLPFADTHPTNPDMWRGQRF